MLTRRIPGILGSCLGAVMMAAAGSVYGFTYVLMDDRELLAGSDVVVSGQVLSAERQADASATTYEVAVEDTFKGAAEQTISITVPGVRNRVNAGPRIPGAPHFTVGSKVLLFLGSEGTTYRISQFALGAFRVVEVAGQEYAVRSLPGGRQLTGEDGVYKEPSNVRDMQSFTTWLRNRTRSPGTATDESRDSEDYFVEDPAVKDAVEGSVTDEFTLFEDESGTNFRWPDYDSGTVVDWGHNGGAEFADQVKSALAAWNDDPASNILLGSLGATGGSAGFTGSDGGNTVLFGDPNDEIPGSFSCETGGTLAIGGIWPDGTHTSEGTIFRTIIEGDVVMQDGAECFFEGHGKADGEEVIGHEIGHGQGLGHSCGDSASGPCDNEPPGDDDALMRAFAHGDGRGAALGQDDKNAVFFVYPGPGDEDGGPLVSVHGSLCQPANLGQAAKLRTSWSQHGIGNPNAVGSGRSFFVACPVTVTDDGRALANPANVWVQVRYDDRDPTNRVTCTVFRARDDGSGFIKSVTASDDSSGTGPASILLELPDIADPGDRKFDLPSESYTVVCALVPQSGIRGIVFDFD